MSAVLTKGRRLAAVLLATSTLVAAALLVSAPAHAAVLFSDDFEQPTVNVWLSGPSWSVVTEDGSKVYKQSSTVNFPYAYAGSGSRTGTTVTARVKPTSPLGPTTIVSLTGKTSDPSNLYYVGFHGAQLEIGQQAWGHNIALADTPFTATVGTWYRLTLSFPNASTVTGTVSGPGGVGATITAADPGGPNPGDHVGFWMNSASASVDDIVLSDQTVPPPPPATQPPCPVALTFSFSFYGSAFLGLVSYKNVSPAPIAPPWTITWQFTAGQTMQSMFSVGSWYQRGPTVTVNSPVWAPPVPAGSTSYQFGFLAGPPNAMQLPANVTFNGIPCQAALA
jgi:hypothetical protein